MLIGVADVVGTKFFDWPGARHARVHREHHGAGGLRRARLRAGAARAHPRRAALRLRWPARPVVHGGGDAHRRLHLLRAGRVAGASASSPTAGSCKEATMGTVRFPLYPARVLLLLGVALLLVRLALDIVADIGRMRRGEAPPAHQRCRRADGIGRGAPVAAGRRLDRGGPAARVAHARRAHRRGARPGRIHRHLPHRGARCGARADRAPSRSAPPTRSPWR